MDNFSYSNELPTISKYDQTQWMVPYQIEQVTMGEGEEAVQQYRSLKLFYPKSPSLSERQVLIAAQLNQDVGAYIYGHYDAGTQQTLQAMVAMDDVPGEVKTQIKSIFPWIQSCLGYYYTKKMEILASETPELVTWDFSQLDLSKPDVTLPGLMAALEA
jgi:hypothetical protein